MQKAIDQFNQDLADGNEGGEERVQRIAKMFKDIQMQEEGMKFYTNFIMLGKNGGQASEQSTVKQIENVVVSMYQNFEDTKVKLGEFKSVQLLEEFSFSQYYAEFYRILIDCIEDYGQSIMALFGLDSLILFLK
jgi:hypothetical protein